MTAEQIFQMCSNTILWTVIGAVLGATLGVVFTNIANKRNSRILLRLWSWEKCLTDGITKDPDLMISVINDSKVAIPLVNVHIMDFAGVNVKLTKIDNDISEIKPGQIVQFNLKVLASDNQLTNDAKQILTAKPKDFAVRVYIDKSNKGPVYTDKDLAKEIFHSISELVGRDFRKKTLIENMPYEERKKILAELQDLQNEK